MGREAGTPTKRRVQGGAKGRSELGYGILISILMILAALADHYTGPELTVTVFYVFPVAIAGWRKGFTGATDVALASGILDVAARWPHSGIAVPEHILFLNHALRLTAWLGIGWLSAAGGRQQQILAEQRDKLAHLNRRLEADIMAAKKLQDVLTGDPPRHPVLETAVHKSAANIVGGDTLHLGLSPDDRLAITMADVSGKGSPAALAGAVLVGLLDDAPGRYVSPSETLRFLNTRLVKRLPDEMFVTVFYGLLDLKTGALVYASGGHEPPFIVRASGELEEIRAPGMPLGILPDETFPERSVTLSPKDMLFCYTDGITDVVSADGSRFDTGGLKELVAGYGRLSCRAVLDSILEQTVMRAVSVPDDVTLLAVRFRGAPTPAGRPQILPHKSTHPAAGV